MPTKVIDYSAPPALGRLYAKAATQRGGGTEVPDVKAVVRDVAVDPQMLSAYSRLCGFAVGGVLPLTLPHVLGFPLQIALMTSPGFPLPALGMVHVENDISVHRVLTPADRLTLSVQAQDLRPHRAGRQIDFVTEASVAGELVWRGVSTYLSRGSRNDDAAQSESPDISSLRHRSGGPVFSFGAGAGREYAHVSGDTNPIHLSALTAKALGFPRAIAHGMFTYATVLASLGNLTPRAQGNSHVWFHKPVLLPSRTALKVEAKGSGALAALFPAKDLSNPDHLVVRNTLT